MSLRVPDVAGYASDAITPNDAAHLLMVDPNWERVMPSIFWNNQTGDLIVFNGNSITWRHREIVV